MRYCFSFLIWVVAVLASCDSTHQVDPVSNYKVEVVSSAEGDIPTGAPVEVVLGFKEFSAKVQQLSFDFPSASLALEVGGATVVPGVRTSVVLEGTSLAKVKVTGRKAGTHKITVRAENGEASSSCVVSLAVSDRVYRVELLNNPILPLVVGVKEALSLKVVDAQDANHLFYQTPGYTISAKSLDAAPAFIQLGVTEVWDNTVDPAVVGSVPLNWASNEGNALYRALSVGEHKVEFSVTAPDGAVSRTVHTLQVDSSKVVLKPRQEPKKVVKVTETHDATFDVDYCGHPTNKVSLMWERLPIGDPYYTAPDVTIDFVRPKAGEWTEYKYAQAIGATSYPFAPAKAGAKQGYRLRVRDMYGWEQAFEYRFEVTSSEYAVSVVASNKPYIQNLINSASLRIENYPANMQFRYKLVRAESGYLAVAFKEKAYDTWYDVNLAGSKGEPYEISMSFAYGDLYWGIAGFDVVVEDKFGEQRTAKFNQAFARNELKFRPNATNLTATVGTPITWLCTLSTTDGKTDQYTFENARWTGSAYDPQAGTLTANNTPFQAPLVGVPPQAITSGSAVSMSYTPSKAGVHEIKMFLASWCDITAQSVETTVRINVLPNAGSFLVSPDKTQYDIPYADSRVYQDIAVTLASANETAGLYDWDTAFQSGTSIRYVSNNSGRLYVLDESGQEVLLTPGATVPLKWAVGKMVRLRHYPAAVNNGSIERINLTATRKDGATASTTFTVDAEDQSFELKERPSGWGDGQGVSYPKVGQEYNIPIEIVNRSKYYRGGYKLKSYRFDPVNIATLRPSTEQFARNIPFNGSLPTYIKMDPLESDVVILRELILEDDYGYSVTANYTTSIIITQS